MDQLPNTLTSYASPTYPTIQIQNLVSQITHCTPLFFFQLAKEMQSITAQEYSIISHPKTDFISPEDQLPAANLLARRIRELTAKSSSTEQCQDQFRMVIGNKARVLLQQNLDMHETVSIACALDFVRFAQKHPVEEIFEMISHKMESIAARCLNLDVWAVFTLRKLNMPHLHCFKSLFHHIDSNIKVLTPLQISLVTIAIVQGRHPQSNLMNSLRKQATLISSDFNANEAINTIWSYCYQYQYPDRNIDPTKIRQENASLIEAFKFKLIDEMSSVDIDQTVRISWCLLKMNVRDQKFFETVEKNIAGKVHTLTEESLINIAKKYCQLENFDEFLITCLMAEILKRLKVNPNCFNSTLLASVTYDLLMKYCDLNNDKWNSFEFIIGTLLYRIANLEDATWENNARIQLKTICAIFKVGSPRVKKDLIGQLEIIAENLDAKKDKYNKSSTLHRKVEMCLKKLLTAYNDAPQHQNEYPFERDFSLDIAFPDLKCAIEVDGPCHNDENGNFLNKNIIKETLLKIRGWELIRISYKDWKMVEYLDQKFLLNALSQFEWFGKLQKKAFVAQKR